MQMGKPKPKVRKLFSAIPNTTFVEGLLCYRPSARCVWVEKRLGRKPSTIPALMEFTLQLKEWTR